MLLIIHQAAVVAQDPAGCEWNAEWPLRPSLLSVLTAVVTPDRTERATRACGQTPWAQTTVLVNRLSGVWSLRTLASSPIMTASNATTAVAVDRPTVPAPTLGFQQEYPEPAGSDGYQAGSKQLTVKQIMCRRKRPENRIHLKLMPNTVVDACAPRLADVPIVGDCAGSRCIQVYNSSGSVGEQSTATADRRKAVSEYQRHHT